MIGVTNVVQRYQLRAVETVVRVTGSITVGVVMMSGWKKYKIVGEKELPDNHYTLKKECKKCGHINTGTYKDE